MYSYAQTNIQLYNQLWRQGYTDNELVQVRDAYACAMRLFTGCFRPNGKTFLAHLVGTASILTDLHAPVPTVTAGLLHAAYSHGEFGTGSRGVSESKRIQLRRVIGQEAETLVARYTTFGWYGQNLSHIANGMETFNHKERMVLLLRLANELEDHLDLGALYLEHAESHRQKISSCLYQYSYLAERLGYPSLGDALKKSLSETVSTKLPAALLPQGGSKNKTNTIYLIGSSNASFCLPPASHRPRLEMRLHNLFYKLRYSGK